MPPGVGMVVLRAAKGGKEGEESETGFVVFLG